MRIETISEVKQVFYRNKDDEPISYIYLNGDWYRDCGNRLDRIPHTDEIVNLLEYVLSNADKEDKS